MSEDRSAWAKRTAGETLVDSTALFTAIIGGAYGAMVAYRLARGQRWMATGLAAIGSANLDFGIRILSCGNQRVKTAGGANLIDLLDCLQTHITV